MYKKNRWIWGGVVAACFLFIIRACANTVEIPVVVLDQDGKPVADVKLESDSGYEAVSNKQGKAGLDVKNKSFSNRLYANKKGYYSSETHSNYSPLNPNIDLSEVVEITLKKTKNPIPMFAKDMKSYSSNGVDIPVVDQEVGYDLLIGDWVAPFGKGKVSDFIFLHQGVRRWSGPKYFREEYEQKIILRFSNNHDGIVAWEGSSEAGRKYGSELASDYKAPSQGYQNRWTQRTWKIKSGFHQTTKNIDRNFYFRVRTKVDAGGNIVSAHYGKIYGDFMSFIYYLNPTPNDRNLEFDPHKNLFKNENVERP